ncbi:MAG: acyl-CoA thioesterase [Firmicutes bacterium]|nr:acyl-CoA thioesterase [Bacillota bacterium]
MSTSEQVRLPQPGANVTVTRVQIRSTDVDAMGHVNNAVYFEYLEQARIDHLRRLLVLPPPEGRRPYAGVMVVAEARCRYRAPLYYGDDLYIETWTAEVRRRGFRLAYRLYTAAEPQRTAAEAETVQVWIDADGRAAAIPDSVRQTLEASIPPA